MARTVWWLRECAAVGVGRNYTVLNGPDFFLFLRNESLELLCALVFGLFRGQRPFLILLLFEVLLRELMQFLFLVHDLLLNVRHLLFDLAN